jgi:hypothetical protein
MAFWRRWSHPPRGECRRGVTSRRMCAHRGRRGKQSYAAILIGMAGPTRPRRGSDESHGGYAIAADRLGCDTRQPFAVYPHDRTSAKVGHQRRPHLHVQRETLQDRRDVLRRMTALPANHLPRRPIRQLQIVGRPHRHEARRSPSAALRQLLFCLTVKVCAPWISAVRKNAPSIRKIRMPRDQLGNWHNRSEDHVRSCPQIRWVVAVPGETASGVQTGNPFVERVRRETTEWG